MSINSGLQVVQPESKIAFVAMKESVESFRQIFIFKINNIHF